MFLVVAFGILLSFDMFGGEAVDVDAPTAVHGQCDSAEGYNITVSSRRISGELGVFLDLGLGERFFWTKFSD